MPTSFTVETGLLTLAYKTPPGESLPPPDLHPTSPHSFSPRVTGPRAGSRTPYLRASAPTALLACSWLCRAPTAAWIASALQCAGCSLGFPCAACAPACCSSCSPGLRGTGPSSWGPGFLAPWHVGSSQSREQTGVSCIGRWVPNHWTTSSPAPAGCSARNTLPQSHPGALLHRVGALLQGRCQRPSKHPLLQQHTRAHSTPCPRPLLSSSSWYLILQVSIHPAACTDQNVDIIVYTHRSIHGPGAAPGTQRGSTHTFS